LLYFTVKRYKYPAQTFQEKSFSVLSSVTEIVPVVELKKADKMKNDVHYDVKILMHIIQAQQSAKFILHSLANILIPK